MATNWIKVEKSTLDKPEVLSIAGALEIDPDAVMGKLLRVWSWFDEHTVDGCASIGMNMLKVQIGRITGYPDLVTAMINVGWLLEKENGIEMVNFERHNSESAKKRADAAQRQAKSRCTKSNNNVTTSCDKRKSLPKKLVTKIYERDEHTCVYCGYQPGNNPPFGPYIGATLSIDHVIPVSKEGTDNEENLVTACTVCNKIKSNRTPEEAKMIASFVTQKCDEIVTNALPRDRDRDRDRDNTSSLRSEVGEPKKKPRKSSAKLEELPSPPADLVSPEKWGEFYQHRITTKKPLTEQAAKNTISQLEKAKAFGWVPDELIEQAIANGWQGVVFERHLRPPPGVQHGTGEKLSALERVKAENERRRRERQEQENEPIEGFAERVG